MLVPSWVSTDVERYFSAMSALGSMIDWTSFGPVSRSPTFDISGPKSAPTSPILWQLMHSRRKTA